LGPNERLPIGEIELSFELTKGDPEWLALSGQTSDRTGDFKEVIGSESFGALPQAENSIFSSDFSVVRAWMNFADRAPPCVFLPASRGVLSLAEYVSVHGLTSFDRMAGSLSRNASRFESLGALLAIAFNSKDHDALENKRARRMWKALERIDDMPKPMFVRGLEIYFRCKDNAIVPLRSLSQGQLALLLMFAEIALRQPDGGIILIDEIEQHLHPRWQRLVMEALTALSPSSQFIVTTQSPIFAAANPDDLVHLGDWSNHGA
jgi:hypothetical protein